jgi:hypothetical protein
LPHRAEGRVRGATQPPQDIYKENRNFVDSHFSSILRFLRPESFSFSALVLLFGKYLFFPSFHFFNLSANDRSIIWQLSLTAFDEKNGEDDEEGVSFY